MYFYNGGGVATGDLSGDGLADIYFTANQEPNKLYLNKGDFKFTDITTEAGVAGFNGWTTGVTMADVNNDGKLDIYVSYLGDYLSYKGKNQLFINEGNNEQGIPTFTDRAMEFGLDLVGFSTQAAFFDYDKDGDLDMFMLNHSLHENGTFGKSTMRKTPHPLAGDKLMRNDNGRFIDATKESGIYSSVLGYGLGVAISDVNMDGWPDIYVGNDFHENDYLYINQGGGRFEEVLEEQMNHTSRYTMGVDLADFNNDAFPDLISMDMLPDNQIVLKSSAAEDPFDTYMFKKNYGYNHQFARNTLQLNNGNNTFSEIGLLAGVSATDWSWSALFADFDLDGNKDIFIANGILRRSNDLDYINFISVDSIQMRMKYDMSEKELEYIKKMPQIKIPNVLYRNNGDSTFTSKSAEWGLNAASYSNGTAYADFDNDGDLDLVINNVDDEALLYENTTVGKTKSKEATNSHFLGFELKGKSPNQFGIGTKVFVYTNGKVQMQECFPTRGYQSSVDYRLLFGISGELSADSVLIVWSDDSFQKLTNVKPDQHLVVDQKDASGVFNYERFHRYIPLFKNEPDRLSINYKHRENNFVEFNREGLIPHMMSAEGPAYALADINGDGREDLFLGGAKWQRSQLFTQSADGKFIPMNQKMLDVDSTYEDVDAAFFDADGDGDNDLFVVSGGNEFFGKSEFRASRLYLNDGKGNFNRSNGLPEIFNTGSCVAVDDIDGDGDLDLFLGTRAIPWRYGIQPDSYVLINDGKGVFKDQTDLIAPALRQFGFVKRATWADMNGDKKNDLIIAADWSPVTILLNIGGKLEKLPLEGSGLEKTNGWWNVFSPGDFDGDGDIDLIAGNLGLNSKLHASVESPVRMYVSDFDKNDSTDQVVTHLSNGKEYPFNTRDEMVKQMPMLKKKYLMYHKFAEASVQDMFGIEALSKAEKYESFLFANSYIENLGGGKFKVRPLPTAAQFAPVRAVWADDFDGDSLTDIILAGNFYSPNIQMGRYDASYGFFLKGNGKGGFHEVPSEQSGLVLHGEVMGLQPLRIGNKKYGVAIRNNQQVEVFSIN